VELPTVDGRTEVIQQVFVSPCSWSYSRDEAVWIQRQREEIGLIDPALDPIALLIKHKEGGVADLRRKQAEQQQRQGV
jgi:hypothetical protein